MLGLAAAACLGLTWGASARAGDATNLEVPLDGSFTIVNFSLDGASGSGPASPGDPNSRNDDDSVSISALTGSTLPFNFNLYGSQRTDLFVNNNGNVSFGQAFSTFTASEFPVNSFPMVAPFWADVDTRNTASGVVHYKLYDGGNSGHVNTLAIIWDNVGYFSNQADKTNTFELLLSDGSNSDMGLGNNVCFSYDDMSWTTGSASGGSGGFGGTPATVGVNKGDGTNFFQIGRFDHEGTDYDGSAGTSDGVSFLDGQDFCFTTAGEGNNLAPIALNFPAQTLSLDANAGDTLNLLLQFIGPEIGQTVTITNVDDGGSVLDGLSYVNEAGTTASSLLFWTPGTNLIGNLYTLTFTFEDNLGLSSQRSLTIEIVGDGVNPVIPLPAAAWMGLMTLGGLGGFKAMRRRFAK